MERFVRVMIENLIARYEIAGYARPTATSETYSYVTHSKYYYVIRIVLQVHCQLPGKVDRSITISQQQSTALGSHGSKYTAIARSKS